MKNILYIFFRPIRAVRYISDEEPLFSGILIFILSVVIGNISFINSLMPSGTFNLITVLAFISLFIFFYIFWTLIVTAIFAIDSASGILIQERFRKMLIILLHISPVFVLQFLLEKALGTSLSWILVSIWLFILILAALSYIWNITEVRALAGMLISLLLMFPVVKFVFDNSFIGSENNLEHFFSIVQKEYPNTNSNIISMGRAEIKDDQYPVLLTLLDGLMELKPDSSSVPYYKLIKSRLYNSLGLKEEALKELRESLLYKTDDYDLINSMTYSISSLVSKFELYFAADPYDMKKYRTLLSFWNLPTEMSGYSGETARLIFSKDIIESDDLQEFEKKLPAIINAYTETSYEDDILFWIAERYRESGEREKAARYYEMSSGLKVPGMYYKSAETESTVYALEDFLGISILLTRNRIPDSLLHLGQIYSLEGKDADAYSCFRTLLDNYRRHYLASYALYELALLAEKKDDFDTALMLFDRLIKEYPSSYLLSQARLQSNIINSNRANKVLLKVYSKAWKKWYQGKREESINIYRRIINEFPDSDLAVELQYGLGEYFTEQKDYQSAITEFRRGFDSFRSSRRGFDFGWKLANILYNKLNYNKNTLSLLNEIMEEYPDGYRSSTGPGSVLDVRWLAADIYKDKLGDYNKALEIYSDIAQKYVSERNAAARARYETGSIFEESFRKYTEAMKFYKSVVELYPDTSWSFEAQKRIELIYQESLKVLERSY